MSDKLNQNSSEKKPFSGMLYQLKVSLFANKLTNWYFSKATLPYWCIMVLDSIAIVVAGMIATYIAGGGELIASHFWNYLLTFICSLPLFVVGMRIFHTYSGIMRYSSFVDLLRISGALVVGFILNSILLMVVPDSIRCELTTEAIVVMLFISMIEMWTMRILVKYMYDSSFSAETKTPVFILGVREGGISLAKSMRNDHPSQYVVKGFSTEEAAVVGRFLLGCKVYSYDETLIGVMHKMNVKTLFVSPLVTEKFLEKQDMIDKLTAEGIKIMMMPKALSWDGKSNLRYQMMHEVDIEDLLPRDKIEVDMKAIGKLLCGRTILITGAAGSIGSEMVKQIAIYKPQRLILVDEAETPMHDVRLFMNKNYADLPCETIVTSITKATRMERIFSEYHPDYVFHAAAYKHVPMMEDNPSEAVQNNIYGTRVIADMAVKYGTKKFVMISTDKAVNPTNVMGCSKRICEIYCQALNKAIVDGEVKGVTKFVTTRFGNVLGSNGSVIPIFKKQLAMGGPLTVTHPDIERFFMTIPEAVSLVLQAGYYAKGGEIFVLDMGQPVKIDDMARQLIRLSGFEPDVDIPIIYTGLRPGEKLYEELLMDEEGLQDTANRLIHVGRPIDMDDEAFCRQLEALERACRHNSPDIRRCVADMVPTYHPKKD